MNEHLTLPSAGPAERREFAAPWGRVLLLISIGMSILCFAVVFAFGAYPPIPHKVSWPAGLLLLTLLAGCGLFAVRGYLVSEETLWVRRLLWSTRVNLRGLRSARFDPEATRGSVRFWGNGGLFSFSGWFWSKRLGRYRLYATDLNRSVVLDWGQRRVVVTPDDPEAFVRRINRTLALQPAGGS